MNVGDLVRCTWQPGSSGIKNDCAMPMEYTIENELGIIVGQYSDDYRCDVMFPQFGYTHILSNGAFEVVGESQ